MSKLTKIAEAADRLERAVLRLEAAMEHAEPSAERYHFETQLASAKAQYTSLARLTQTVASRLDGAILRLDRVLEE
jgi:exonuclease VII small subunit